MLLPRQFSSRDKRAQGADGAATSARIAFAKRGTTRPKESAGAAAKLTTEAEGQDAVTRRA
jgi:hypothetical protein